jgi:hypothetical protein
MKIHPEPDELKSDGEGILCRAEIFSVDVRKAPRLVLREIFICSGVSFVEEDLDKNRKKLVENYLLLKRTKFSKDLRKWARQVNPYMSFSREILLRKISAILNFRRDIEIKCSAIGFSDLTKDSCPLTALYSKIQTYDLPYEIESWEMFNIYDMTDKYEIFSKRILETINVCKTLFISKALSEKVHIDYEILEKSEVNLSVTRETLPRTNVEAIVFAAKFWGLDIVNSEYPLKDYHSFRQFGKVSTEKLSKKIKKDPYSLSLSINFQEKLPRKFYPRNVLEQFCTNYGLDIKDPYFSAYQFNTGERWSTSTEKIRVNETNVFGETEEDCELVFYYGNEKVYWFSLEELIAMFKSNFCLENCYNKEEMKNIEQLQFLLNLRDYPNFELRLELLKVITEIKTLLEDKTKVVDTFCSRLSEERETLVILIYHLGLYMRGWDGISVPILREFQSSKTQNEIDIKVNEAYHNLLTHLKKCHKTTEVLYKFLPVYVCWDNVVRVRLDLNLNEKITNVFNKPDDVMSCIRLTSNNLIVTSHVLYNKITGKDLFDFSTFETCA